MIGRNDQDRAAFSYGHETNSRNDHPDSIAGLFLVGAQGVAQGEVGQEQFLAWAGGAELARQATEQSTQELLTLLLHLNLQSDRTLLIPFAVQKHAAALSALGQGPHALRLAEAVFPVLETAPDEIRAVIAMSRGELLGRLRHFARAEVEFGRAVEIRERLVGAGRDDQRNSLAGSHLNRGVVREGQQKLREALADYEVARRIRQGLLEDGRLEDENELASAHMNKGNVLRTLRFIDEAIAEHDQSIAIRTRLVQAGGLDVRTDLALALMNKGAALATGGLLAEAAREFAQSAELFVGLVDEGHSLLRNDLASVRMNQGNVLRLNGHVSEAIAKFEEVIQLRLQLIREGQEHLREDLASALLSQGIAFRLAGQFSVALDRFDQAIDRLEELIEGGRHELNRALAQVRSNKGNVLQSEERLAEAIKEYDATDDLLTGLIEQGRSELRDELATNRMSRGIVLQTQGRLPEAIAAFEDVIQMLTELVQEGRRELCADLARAYLNLGNSLQLAREFKGGQQSFHQAIALLTELIEEGRSDLRNTMAFTRLNLGVLLDVQEQPIPALSEFEAAENLLQELIREGQDHLAPTLAGIRLNKVNTLRLLSRLSEAAAQAEVLKPVQFVGDDLRKYHGVLAELYWDLGQREECLQQLALARRAFCAARRAAGIDETVLEYLARREDFFEHTVLRPLQMGCLAVAWEAMQDAKATIFGDLFDIRAERAPPQDAETLITRRTLTAWLSDRSTCRLTLPDDGQSVPDRSSELQLRTAAYLKAWRRKSRRSDQMPPQVPVSMSAVQSALAPEWGVLDFWRTDGEEFTVLLLTKDGLDQKTISFPLSDGRLGQAMDDVRLAVSHPEQAHRLVDEVLDELGDRLFSPLLPLLKAHGLRGLYLVAHDLLHRLPLHALRVERQYLGDRFDVAYLPSAALLPQLPALDWRQGEVLSLTNPERDSGPPHSLPFADWEGAQVRQRFGQRGGRFLSGRSATLAATESWSEAGLLHFSCHGHGDAMFAPLSHLRLADDLLLAHDVVYRRPPLRPGCLVLLNGCQTAVRDERAINEGLGLTTAFLLRGAALVLSTLWSVEDFQAGELMLAFLSGMEMGLRPAAALRQAQLKVREMASDAIQERRREISQSGNGLGFRYLSAEKETESPAGRRQPAHWAAFQLVGRVT